MRIRILFALLASCLTSGCLTEAMVDARRARYAESNARCSTEALEKYRAEHHLTEVAESMTDVGGIPAPGGGAESFPPTKLALVAQAPAQGLHNAEWLLRTQEGDPGVVFASRPCSMASGSCEDVPSYAFAKAPDGHTVVLRLNPRINTHRVKQFGSCTHGQGVAPQPIAPTGYHLPQTDPSKVEIADVPYDRDMLQVSCMNEVPAP